MQTEATLFTQKKQLIEEIGTHLEKEEQLSPVASRIYATILICCNEGVTFEQLTKEMGSSKSTVFNHLNTLETSGRIEYFSKPGDRKRYYVPISNQFIRFIDEKIRICASELSLQQKIIHYKKTANELWEEDSSKQYNLKFHHNILVFLEESIASFKRLKENLSLK